MSEEKNIADLVRQGIAYHEAGNLQSAEQVYRYVLQSSPEQPDANRLLGVIAAQVGQFEVAQELLERALRAKPRMADAYANLGTTYHGMGNLEKAIDCYKKAVKLRPDFTDPYINLAMLHESKNELDKAAYYNSKALQNAPGSYPALITQALLLRRAGHYSKAIDSLQQLINAENPELSRTHFELGKAYDLAGEYAKAFEHFGIGNQLQAGAPKFQADSSARYNLIIDTAVATINPAWLSRFSKINPKAASRSPIFLVGFTRSGTTLLDQVLDSHPSLQVMEEKSALFDSVLQLTNHPEGYPGALLTLSDEDVEVLRDYYFSRVREDISREEDKILVDKFPLNTAHIPIMLRLFPDAKIVFAQRHPMDVILSNFMQRYEIAGAMRNFTNLGESVDLYKKVLGLWFLYEEHLKFRFHIVRYESLVEDFEQEIRSLLNFLELEWDDRVLEFHQHARSRKIDTPSYQSVVQPVYQSAKYRWRNYSRELEDVGRALATEIERLGYAEG